MATPKILVYLKSVQILSQLQEKRREIKFRQISTISTISFLQSTYYKEFVSKKSYEGEWGRAFYDTLKLAGETPKIPQIQGNTWQWNPIN